MYWDNRYTLFSLQKPTIKKQKTMKSNLIYAALGALALSMPAAAQSNPTIYGSVVFGHLWEDMGDEAPYGLYSVPADNGDAVKMEVRSNDIKANGGGVYVDGMYYLVDFSRYNTEQVVTFRTFDTTANWKLINEQTIKTYSNVASDLAYDPTNDKIYGCFKETPTSTQYFLGTLNPITGFAQKIGNIKEELIALASTRDGKLYGIGLYGMLYSIDKETATLTEIGQTGKTVKYAQSATFDYASSRMFWAMTPHYTDQAPEICEVNLSDGSVKTLATLPNRYEFTGIYTLSSYAADGAPSKAPTFGGDYPNGALTGNIVFAAPNTTMNGKTLSGDLTYTLVVDNQKAISGNTTAGGNVSVAKTLKRGMHYMRVATQNAEGRSPWRYTYFWAGIDNVKPKAAVAMTSAGNVDIMWSAPEEGEHGGYFDPADVRYTVTRQPDNVLVYEGNATDCTDNTVGDIQYGVYYYEVVATTGGYSGEAVKTDEIQLGSTATLPYTMTFDSEAEAKSLYIDDANNDGNTWEFYADCMICGVSDQNLDDDDWLITPPFEMNTEEVYQVSVDAYGDESYVKKMEIAVGKEQRGKSLTQVILPATVVAEGDYKTYTTEFVPESDGKTFVGIHTCSPFDYPSYITVDNLRITKLGSVYIPAAATDATAKAVGAEKRVIIEFNAPSKNMKAEALASNLTTITVTNTTTNKVVKTFNNVAPGTRLSVEDTPQSNGMNEYAIVASNEHGKGKTISISTYVGYDRPATITDAKVTATDDGAVQLAWTAPTEGANGGYIDASSLKYTIGNLNGSSLRSTVVTTNAYSEQLTMKEGEQKLAWYTITPETTQGKGEESSSDTVFVGKPYALPYLESFAKQNLQRGPWCPNYSDLAKWDIMQYGTYADPEDADHGLIAFSTITPGAKAELIGPKLTLQGSNHPILKFALYQMKRSTHTLNVQLITPDGKRHTLGSYVPNNTEAEGNEGEWAEETLALDDYKQYDYVQLVFHGIGGMAEDLASIVPLYVDNIRITDPLNGNLALTTFSTTKTKVEVGEDVPFKVTIENKGTDAAEGYTVKLYRNGNCVRTQKGETLKAGRWTDITLKDVPNADAKQSSIYTAEVEWDSDENASDNVSKNVVVTVLPGKPYIEAAFAQQSATNGVTLSWSEPQNITAGTTVETVTEDFESYLPFTIEHFGEWTLYDGDKHSTTGIQDGNGYFVQYDNVEAPMAYQVFNPSAAGINEFYFPTHSGKQVAATFTVGRNTANDDWLISPEVDGAQTIKFWACSPDANYYGTNEKVEVYYSTTGTATTDFKKIGSTITVPASWKEYTANLPEGTRYFALRCVSLDQYILFVDDITYRKAARDFSLLGYNVYRNDELLTATPIATTSFSDNAGSENDEYSVSVVYNVGESRKTPAIWGDPTSIGAVATDSDNTTNAVYDLAGRRLADGATLGKGVFIVKQNGRTKKVLVK